MPMSGGYIPIPPFFCLSLFCVDAAQVHSMRNVAVLLPASRRGTSDADYTLRCRHAPRR